MASPLQIGVLALQGDVREHVAALEAASRKAGIPAVVSEVRTKEEAAGLDGLVIPGGESTVLEKLCAREGLIGAMKRIPALFGTCAGAILMARIIAGKAEGQGSLGRIDIAVVRNAYGRQNESFEADINTDFGPMRGVFIRAPRMSRVGKNVHVLARRGAEPIACEEVRKGRYALATCFHPELTTTKFHEHFLRGAQAARAA